MARLASLLAAAALLAACDLTTPWTAATAPAAPSITVDATSVTFTRFPGGVGLGGFKTVGLTVGGAGVAAVGYGLADGAAEAPWLGLDLLQTGSAAGQLRLYVADPPQAPTARSTAIVLLAVNAAGRIVAQSSPIQVTLQVVALPTFSPGALVLGGWIERGLPLPGQATLTGPTGVTLGQPQVDAGWCAATLVDGLVTVAGTTAAASVQLGSHAATVSVPVTVDLDSRAVSLPVSATVGPAMQLPPSIAITVDATTTSAQLSTTATVTALLPGGFSFVASSGAPWLTVSPAGTAAPTGVIDVAVAPGALVGLANGTHATSIDVAPSVAGLSSGTVPVTLTLSLPRVDRVAPVAYSDALTTDYVVVRGAGFSSPGFALTVDGAAPDAVTVVNDSTAHVVPGARAPGDHPVATANALGLARPSAALHVVDRPSFADASLVHALGAQERVFASARHQAVFGVFCYFCGYGSSGTPSTLQRFAFDASSGAWSATSRGYPLLWDAVLAPDESTLAVLTTSDLLLVDPVTLDTTRTIPLPGALSGTSSQLAVTNDGLVMVQTLRKAWSLRDEGWVSMPFLDYGLGLGASADGSRVIWGEATNGSDVPYRFYDAATGLRTISATRQHYSRGKVSRHAERSIVNSYVLDHDLALLWSGLPVSSHVGDLSPDGRWACGYDAAANRVRCFDLDTPPPYLERAAITPAAAPGGVTRAVMDPAGDFLFLVGEQRLVVVDVRP